MCLYPLARQSHFPESIPNSHQLPPSIKGPEMKSLVVIVSGSLRVFLLPLSPFLRWGSERMCISSDSLTLAHLYSSPHWENFLGRLYTGTTGQKLPLDLCWKRGSGANG